MGNVRSDMSGSYSILLVSIDLSLPTGLFLGGGLGGSHFLISGWNYPRPSTLTCTTYVEPVNHLITIQCLRDLHQALAASICRADVLERGPKTFGSSLILYILDVWILSSNLKSCENVNPGFYD